MLLESLNEILKENLFQQLVQGGVSKGKGIDMQNLLNKCVDAQKSLLVCIEELGDCIRSAIRVYKYYISWLVVVVKNKAKIGAIEDELSALGKSFDFLEDEDGEQRKRINSLQGELLFL